MKIFELLASHGHERLAFHHDQATGLRAIIAIHSTVLGNALGGTRRWAYTDEAEAIRDVLRLSEGMTYKSAAAELPMGGAKSVILAKPGAHPTEAEARAMGRFVDTFGGTYIAAEDVGVNTQFCDWMATETPHIMGGETVSHGGDPSPFTSLGCFNGMKACLKHLGKKVDFSGLTVAIQGVGATGYKLAKLCRDAGAKVIATDVNRAALDRAVKDLGIEALGTDDNLFHTKCDIVAPCALGGVLDHPTIDRLQCQIVCGTANNQLLHPGEDGPRLKARGIVYGPDFVVNAGGLIRLAGLYLGMSEQEIDRKVEAIEHTTLAVLKEGSSSASTHHAAVEYAKRRIEAGRSNKRAVTAG
ncbi:MAG: Glu/Leu/Phe/Val dehydrogenase [Phycisphaeraceae bacterium]|nr:Glu/Leu/Phe/Val dehydrogenase [Phycisphaeraceae bacterium]